LLPDTCAFEGFFCHETKASINVLVDLHDLGSQQFIRGRLDPFEGIRRTFAGGCYKSFWRRAAVVNLWGIITANVVPYLGR
jgi:hypothetical protein